MPQTLWPVINGHRYSFASIEAEFDGVIIPGIATINYSDELTPGEIYGADPSKVGRTPGRRQLSCDFEMLRREWDILRDRLGQSFGRRPFEISVQYAETPSEPVVTDRLTGCRVVKVDAQNAEGTDPTLVRVTCNPMDLLWGAKRLSLDEVDPGLTAFEEGSI